MFKKGKKKSEADLESLKPDAGLTPAPPKDPTLYEVIGVDETATQEEIEAAYRKAAKDSHPDLHSDDPKASSKFQLVQKAGAVLRDPSRRRLYDQTENEDVKMGNLEPWKQKMISLFFEVANELLSDQKSFKYKNLFGLMKMMLESHSKRTQASIENAKLNIELRKALAERIEGGSFFGQMIDGEIRRLEIEIERAEAEIKDNDRIILELKVYKYKYEEPPAPDPRAPSTMRVSLGSIFGQPL